MNDTEFTVHGYLTLSNHGGLEIEISPDGTGARLRYYGEVQDWQELKYDDSQDPKGYDPYVTLNGADKYFLSEFMKAGYPYNCNIRLNEII